MQINNISNQRPSFGRLFTGESVKNALTKKNCPKALLNKFKGIRKYIWGEKLSSKNYVDITLKYTEKDGFYGVISSKDKKIPYDADFSCKVNPRSDSLENFKEWVNKWNTVFSGRI